MLAFSIPRRSHRRTAAHLRLLRLPHHLCTLHCLLCLRENLMHFVISCRQTVGVCFSLSSSQSSVAALNIFYCLLLTFRVEEGKLCLMFTTTLKTVCCGWMHQLHTYTRTPLTLRTSFPLFPLPSPFPSTPGPSLPPFPCPDFNNNIIIIISLSHPPCLKSWLNVYTHVDIPRTILCRLSAHFCHTTP